MPRQRKKRRRRSRSTQQEEEEDEETNPRLPTSASATNRGTTNPHAGSDSHAKTAELESNPQKGMFNLEPTAALEVTLLAHTAEAGEVKTNPQT
eukprot:1575803-Amphidinium_carterae.1